MKKKQIVILSFMLFFLIIIIAGIYVTISDAIDRETLKKSNGDYINNTWLEYLSRVEQQSDGILEITIEKSFIGCLSIGQPVKIKFKINNLSTQSIYINSNFKISPSKLSNSGNMLPVFFTNEMKIIFLPLDLIDPGFENLFEIHDGIKLEPYEVYQGEIELIFPDQIVDNSQVDSKYITPRIGEYFLKIVYSNSTVKEFYWNGKISSNLLEVCIK